MGPRRGVQGVNHASVRFWRLLVALLATVIALTGPHPGTTSASAAIFTYDAPAIVGVNAHEIADSLAAPAQLTGAREWSASPPTAGQGASTTFSARNNATEAAGPGGKAFWRTRLQQTFQQSRPGSISVFINGVPVSHNIRMRSHIPVTSIRLGSVNKG